MLAVAALVAGALAAPPRWDSEPYVDPSLRLGAVVVNGVTSAQAIGGLEAGYRYRWTRKPWWLGRTRAAGTLVYGLNTNSLGAGVALGSFIGPDGKYVRLQSGPDLWADFYGTPRSYDYYLPPTLGVSLDNTLTFKLHGTTSLVFGGTPSWVTNEDRRYEGLGPIHQLSVLGAVVLHLDRFALAVGWRRSWTSAGITDALVLSSGL